MLPFSIGKEGFFQKKYKNIPSIRKDWYWCKQWQAETNTARRKKQPEEKNSQKKRHAKEKKNSRKD